MCEINEFQEKEREGWSLKAKRRKIQLEGVHFPRRGWHINQGASLAVMVGLFNEHLVGPHNKYLLGHIARVSACIQRQIGCNKC